MIVDDDMDGGFAKCFSTLLSHLHITPTIHAITI